MDITLGSSLSVYNSELGYPSSLEEKERFSHPEFFGRALPLALAAAGFPLLGTWPVAGFLLLPAAFMLFFVVFR